MMAQGAWQGNIVHLMDSHNESGSRVTSIVHRAALLHELLRDVPADRMHTSKKLESIDRNDNGSLTLHLYVFNATSPGATLLTIDYPQF